MRPHHLHLVALLALVAPPGAPADLPVLLLDERLSARPVVLVGIDEGQATFVDEGGRTRTEPLIGYVAIVARDALPGSRAPRYSADGVLELVDGQILPGSVQRSEGDTGGPDALGWRHPVFGAAGVPLEQVAHVRLARAETGATLPARTETDTLLLVNGDRLEGFVASIGADVVVEAGGQARTAPLERIAEVRLANPRRPLEGMVAWLADGSVVRVDLLESTPGGELLIRPSPLPGDGQPALRSAAVPPSSVLAIAVDAARLQPLGGLSPIAGLPAPAPGATVVAPDEPPALLGATDIPMHGPIVVQWDLPPRAARLSLTAELPEEYRLWGDCELVITLEAASRTELARLHLSGDAPSTDVNVELGDRGVERRLEIRVEAGRYGPVQDRPVLRRALLLLAPR